MSETPDASASPKNHKNQIIAVLVAAAIVVGGIVLSVMNRHPAVGSGIVYPVNGQTITGKEVVLYSTFSLDTAALGEALRKNGKKASLESITAGEVNFTNHFQYVLNLTLADGDVLSVDDQAYNKLIASVPNSPSTPSVPSTPSTPSTPPTPPAPSAPSTPSTPSTPSSSPLPAALSWPYSATSLFIDNIVETDNSQVNQPEFDLAVSGSDKVQDLLVLSLGATATDTGYQDDQGNQVLYCDDFNRANYDWSQFTLRSGTIGKHTATSITVSLPSSELKTGACFYAALRGDASSIRPLFGNLHRPALAKLAMTDLFNPDQNFESLLTVSFDTPFLDFKKKRTPDEELAYRLSFKQKLAALLSLSPAVAIKAEDITLYPDRAVVPLLLKEKSHYQVTIAPGQDVFGEPFVAQTLTMDTGDLKYLGLRVRAKQSVFMTTALPQVEVLHVAVADPTVKICSVGIEEYGKIELMVSHRHELDGSEAFLQSGIDQLPVKHCQEQLVTLSKDSYHTPVDMTKLLPDPVSPGLYYMTFSFQGDRKIAPDAPAAEPVFFAVVDAHITMKLSKNGKAMFWVNDFATGKGIPGMTMTAYQNTFTASEGHWDDVSGQYSQTYFSPLKSAIYSPPVTLGKTDADGFLDVDLSSDDYINAFRTWYDDPQYRSLLVTASDGSRLSYVVSKWNSGIADWNFGYTPEYYDPTPSVSAHLYPDRKLYLPGETIHFKAIVRANGKQLTIPTGKKFDFSVVDSNGNSILDKTIGLNDFGSDVEDVVLKDDASLGSYRADLKTLADEGGEFIQTTTFNVEQFQKPTFKIEVAVDSPDLQNDQFKDPTITDGDTTWGYRYKTYEKNLNLNASVDASYYAGGKVSNAPFTYTVFKQYYYDTSFWDDCYYGCYWEPSKDYYSEGSGVLDADGKATVSIAIDHQTSWDDYRYIVEFAVTDPSSQKVAGSGSVLVKIPDGLRQGNPYVNIQLDVDRHFVAAGDSIALTIKPERKWSTANDGHYQLTLKRRQYTSKQEKQVGGDMVPQLDYEDTELEKTLVSTANFKLNDDGTLTKSIRLPDDGDYFLILEEVDPANNNFEISRLNLYAYTPGGITNAPVVADNKIAVVAEKTSYHLGETARLLVRFPFAEGKALVTIEKKNVVSKELMDVKGNTLIKEYPVDDTFVPNAYISIIAFKPTGCITPPCKGDGGSQPEYKVGYTEIVVDKTDKKLTLEAKTNADTYSPRDKVSLDLSATDPHKNPVQAEVSVAVVDESLIAILGNIDLDILPKFFTKIVFQTQTALTNVAMLQQLYFARKGVIGGSGGKEGGDNIVTRSNFKNTAFYAGSVVTDANGKAHLTFDLPDNIGEFRIIVIGDTKTNFFGATEKTISVRQEVTVEETFPLIARSGDDMRVGATVYNNSSADKNIFLSLDADGLTLSGDSRQKVAVKAGTRQFVTWPVHVGGTDGHDIHYTISAVDEKTDKGDRLEKSVPIVTMPLIANRLHFQDDFQTSVDHSATLIPDINVAQSRIELSFSTSILAGIEKIISSLLEYPYGCIEQTISSTLPNAIVKKFQSLLDIGIDQKTLAKNLDAGVKRFASMQTSDGGFAFWAGETTTEPHITPFAILSIVEMRDLGVDIPADMLDRAKTYLENQVKSLSGTITPERLSQLVQETHALSRLDSAEFASARILIQNRIKDLTEHEKIVYALALAKNDAKNYHDEIAGLIAQIDLTKVRDEKEWAIDWFWDDVADKAMYAQLLIRFNPDDQRIRPIIKELYTLDLGSYYYSTQSKIQTFIAFADYLEHVDTEKNKTASVSYQLGSKKGRVTFNDGHTFKKLSFPLADVLGSDSALNLHADSANNVRVYTDLIVYQIPQDPTTIQPQQDKGITVSRQYFKLGAVKETDHEWWQTKARDLAPVSGDTLKLGETYLVKMALHFDNPQRQVAIESYLPAGLKIINTAFLTEQTQVGADQWDWPFYHQEFRADRFFATADSIDNYYRDVEVTYYVRATIAGTFLEPPASVYPMYRPEVEGHTEFRKITIAE